MTTNTTATPRRSATHTRDLILSTLAGATEPVTVTELAERAGMGKSTLSKHLPALEEDGLAVRTPGGREGRRRLPDAWQATPTTSVSPDMETGQDACAPRVEESGNGKDDSTAAEDETVPEAHPQDGLAHPTSGPVAEPTGWAGAVQGAPALKAPVSGESARATDTRVGAVAEQDLNPVSGSTRLAPGELKLMVKAILDSDPGEEFTATAISHILQGRSIGAIQNNLARLAKEDGAVQTCDRPRRYRSA